MADLNRMVGGLRCRDLLTMLTDYVDGELPAEMVKKADGHLTDCAVCAKFGQEYGGLVNRLSKGGQSSTSMPAVRDRLFARLDHEWEQDG